MGCHDETREGGVTKIGAEGERGVCEEASEGVKKV